MATPTMNSIALFLSLGLLSAGDDCNGNGIPDEQDIAGGPRFGWLVVSRGRQRLRTRGQTLADFDADGDPDIAIPDLLSRVFLAFGDGAGAFPDSLLFTAGGPHALAIEAGDVDRDGDQDLLAAEFNTGTAVHLLENDGLGTFARQALPPTPSGTSDIVLGDLDGRGNLDCLLIAGNGSAMVLLNERGLEARATVREIPPLSTAAVLTDCDGDGDLDVVLANQERSEISTLRNLEAGRFGMASVMVALPADVIRAADLNQDGAEDLVLAGQQLTTLGSLGNGAFGVVDQHFLEEPARTLDLGDFDRDGRMDAVVSGDRVVVVHRNAGGMVLEPDREYLTGDTFSAVAADDLDRDGDIDLVACGIDGILSSRLNQGDGSFQVPPILRLPAGARALSMVDLDGDGDQEAAMLGDSFGGPSWLFTHENTGDRRFALSQRILCPREHPGRASLAPVDVDVDGDLDLLAAGTNWGAVYVLTHDDRRFSPPQDFFLQAGVGFLLAENLDGDADTDVILQGW
jgi:hypothetical protein